MDAPGSVVFAPDGRSLTYLWSPDATLVRSLWRHDLATGERTVIAVPMAETTREETLLREDQLQRERTRTSELGVTTFAWATDASEPTLLVPMGGRLFVSWGADTDHFVRQIPGVERASGALLSPDGSHVSYSIEGDLHVSPVRGGAPVRITDDAEPGIFNGLAEFVAAEELDRFEGAWWSADSHSLAYRHVDERDVPPFRIAHAAGREPADELHHYPFAGGPNAHVSLRVASVTGAGSRDVNLGMRPDDYLARVVPHPGRVLADGRILRSTERSGFRHLDLRAPDGGLERVLTTGEWVVTGVTAVSSSRREVLFMATRDGALERHLYAVPWDAPYAISEPERLSTESGWHAVVASPDGERSIDT